MKNILLFPAGIQDSCHYASRYLEEQGISLTDHPSPDITHLLLDVPSFNNDQILRNGHNTIELLRMLPETTTVIGGNLESHIPYKHSKIDLLKDPLYLAKNAAITAECALQVAAPYLSTTYADATALILGWGRIGKQLAFLLRSLGCTVTVAARNKSDRALLEALGYFAVDYPQIFKILPDIRILFNTVPTQALDRKLLDHRKDCIIIDLASAPGLTCDNIIPARGLPGKYAPETSGKLIAQTFLRLLKEEYI